MIFFDNFWIEWGISVGEAERDIGENKKMWNALCELTKGPKKINMWKEDFPKVIKKLSQRSVVDLFLNGQYEINSMGIDVLYHTCRLVLKK